MMGPLKEEKHRQSLWERVCGAFLILKDYLSMKAEAPETKKKKHPR